MRRGTDNNNNSNNRSVAASLYASNGRNGYNSSSNSSIEPSQGRPCPDENLGLTRPIVWKSDFDRTVLETNCRKRQWVRCPSSSSSSSAGGDSDSDDRNDSWNVYWASVASARYLFNPQTRFRLRDDQVINHFPNHSQLTRKDLMVKNIKRYRREREKEARGQRQQQRDEADNNNNADNNSSDSSEVLVEFLPLTYVLPSEYSLFVEEFRRRPSFPWIMKPADRSQGNGIFLVHRVSQVSDQTPCLAHPAGLLLSLLALASGL
jgi:hypothetical protein